MPKSSDLRRLREKLKALEEGGDTEEGAADGGGAGSDDVTAMLTGIDTHPPPQFPLDQQQMDTWEKSVIEQERAMLQVEKHNEAREAALHAKLQWIAEKKELLITALPKVGASTQLLKAIVTPDCVDPDRVGDGPHSRLGSGAPQTWQIYGEEPDVVQLKRKHHALLQRVERLDRVAQQTNSLSLRETSAVRNEQRVHMLLEGLSTLDDLHTRVAREAEWLRIKTAEADDLEVKYTKETTWCADSQKLLVVSEQKARAVRKGVPLDDASIQPLLSSVPSPEAMAVAIRELPTVAAVHETHPYTKPAPPDPAGQLHIGVQDVCRMTMSYIEELVRAKALMDVRIAALNEQLQKAQELAVALRDRQERVNGVYQDKAKKDERRRNFDTSK